MNPSVVVNVDSFKISENSQKLIFIDSNLGLQSANMDGQYIGSINDTDKRTSEAKFTLAQDQAIFKSLNNLFAVKLEGGENKRLINNHSGYVADFKIVPSDVPQTPFMYFCLNNQIFREPLREPFQILNELQLTPNSETVACQLDNSIKDGNIYYMSLDPVDGRGNNLYMFYGPGSSLINGSGRVEKFALTPDLSRLVMLEGNLADPTKFDILVRHVSGSPQFRLNAAATNIVEKFDAWVVTPDSKRIIYQDNNALYVRNLDDTAGTTKVFLLGNLASVAQYAKIVVTADSSKIIYVKGTTAGYSLYAKGLDGSAEQKISGDINIEGSILNFQVSSDSKRAVYRTSRNVLYAAEIDGSFQTKINAVEHPDMRIASDFSISPDSKRVAYTSYLLAVGGFGENQTYKKSMHTVTINSATVTQPNAAPVWRTVQNQTSIFGQGSVISIPVSDEDSRLSINITARHRTRTDLPALDRIYYTTAKEFPWPATAEVGVWDVTATAADAGGLSATSNPFTVTVIQPNRPPEFTDSTPISRTVEAGKPMATIILPVSDPDGDILEFLEYSPVGTLPSNNCLFPIFSKSATTPVQYKVDWTPSTLACNPGNYTFKVLMRDPSGLPVTSPDITITVTQPNRAPEFTDSTPISRTVEAGKPMATIILPVSDPDGDILEFVEYSPVGTVPSNNCLFPVSSKSATTPVQYKVDWTPSTLACNPGNYAFKVLMRDPGGLSVASPTITVTVTNPPKTPEVTINGTLVNGTKFTASTVTVRGSFITSTKVATGFQGFSDKITEGSPDGAIIKNWTSLPGNASQFVNIAITASGFTSNLVSGSKTYYLSVKAQDRMGIYSSVGSAAFKVDAVKPNAPLINTLRPSSVSSITAQWTIPTDMPSNGSGIAGYEYELYKGSTRAIPLTSIGVNQKIFTGLSRGAYTLRVRAIDKVGNGSDFVSRSITL